MLLERRAAGTVDRLGGIGQPGGRSDRRADRQGDPDPGARSPAARRLPTTFDRLLALRFGTAAVRAIAAGAFGTMVAYTPPTISTVPLADVVGRTKTVPLDSDTLQTARDLGISFGD